MTRVAEEDFNRAQDPLTVEFAANVRLQIWRFAVHPQKPGKRLQPCQHLPWRRTSAKLWRSTLRATEFQPASIIKI
jgi:hypothetical protein